MKEFRTTLIYIYIGFSRNRSDNRDIWDNMELHVHISWRGVLGESARKQLHLCKLKRNKGTRMANNKCRHKLMLIGPFGQTSSLNSALSHSLIEQTVPFFLR